MLSEIEGILYGKTLDFSDVISMGGKNLTRIGFAGIRW